jgi:hypothetical protein
MCYVGWILNGIISGELLDKFKGELFTPKRRRIFVKIRHMPGNRRTLKMVA